MKTITINTNRLTHQLTLYGMSKEELLERLSKGLKNKIKEVEVFGNEIKFSTLKKIDSFFKKGLSYYVDPKDPIAREGESIFLRKNDFNAELNFRSKQIIHKYEEEKINFSTLIKLSDFQLTRNIPVYRLSDKPQDVANKVREILYPDFKNKVKEFLESFIAKLAENNVLVFEFVEMPNQKEKVNFEGFYLSPNVIVLRRNQKSFTREIFTLAHELGHYVLDKEEIDTNVEQPVLNNERIDDVEKWCNSFAYYFLIGNLDKEISAIKIADDNNDYLLREIKNISRKAHLSTLSLYTKLLLSEKISPFHYSHVREHLLDEIEKQEQEKKRQLEIKKQQALLEGKEPPRGGISKPIISPLYFQTMRTAFDYGLINEIEFCDRLKINPEKLQSVLYNANY